MQRELGAAVASACVFAVSAAVRTVVLNAHHLHHTAKAPAVCTRNANTPPVHSNASPPGETFRAGWRIRIRTQHGGKWGVGGERPGGSLSAARASWCAGCGPRALRRTTTTLPPPHPRRRAGRGEVWQRARAGHVLACASAAGRTARGRRPRDHSLRAFITISVQLYGSTSQTGQMSTRPSARRLAWSRLQPCAALLTPLHAPSPGPSTPPPVPMPCGAEE